MTRIIIIIIIKQNKLIDWLNTCVSQKRDNFRERFIHLFHALLAAGLSVTDELRCKCFVRERIDDRVVSSLLAVEFHIDDSKNTKEIHRIRTMYSRRAVEAGASCILLRTYEGYLEQLFSSECFQCNIAAETNTVILDVKPYLTTTRAWEWPKLTQPMC